MKRPNVFLLATFFLPLLVLGGEPNQHPNVVLLMSDDQGWGDTGFNGHPKLKTPHLDDMAKSGLRFDRFYAPTVCSPTRGSCLTGRHPYRYGIFNANVGHLPAHEITLAEILKQEGYVTGHFGKWHVGTLTKTEPDANRGGPKGAAHYSPPWENGFDVCFSTESKVPTWDPGIKPRDAKDGGPWWDPVTNETEAVEYGTAYWSNGQKVTEGLRGDDSKIVMDRALPFIQEAVKEGKPFCALIWFHAPHLPVVAGPEYTQLYADCEPYERHYYGCITAMDEQIGRLRTALREMKVADNTLVWFCSDNGPEGREGQAPGSNGGLRGRKRDLWEGGIRVPAILEWPATIKAPRVVTVPCVTSDILPTVLNYLRLPLPVVAPRDGTSLRSIIEDAEAIRSKGIGFELGNMAAWIDGPHKLVARLKNEPAQDKTGERPFKSIADVQLFDVEADAKEENDLSAAQPEMTKAMREALERWRRSCRQSQDGRDYAEL